MDWEEVSINKKARILKVLSDALEHLEQAKTKLDAAELTDLAKEVSKLKKAVLEKASQLIL